MSQWVWKIEHLVQCLREGRCSAVCVKISADIDYGFQVTTVHAYSSGFEDWQRWTLAMLASEARTQRGRERRYVGLSLWTRKGRLSDWYSETRENGYD